MNQWQIRLPVFLYKPAIVNYKVIIVRYKFRIDRLTTADDNDDRVAETKPKQ